MFQQDYLMRLIWQFVEAMRRTVEKRRRPRCESRVGGRRHRECARNGCERGTGAGARKLRGHSERIGTDPHVVEYLVRGMALESYYLEQAGKQQAAQLRFDQACALAATYGIKRLRRVRFP